MHDDELPADADLVRRLVADQFPDWADLPVEPFATGGTTNWIFLLGDERYVRLPRRPGYASNIETEQVWLRRLAPQLPTRIPTPQGLGRPSADFPEPWSIYDWLPGLPATPDQQRDPAGLALDVAELVRSIRSIEAPDAPTPNPANAGRGCPLASRDDRVRRALVECERLVDVDAARAAWERALAAPAWDEPPALLHGDLIAGNLLVVDGRLSGVIDWGCLSLGDPATDLLAAWAVFGPSARQVFRDAVAVDEAAWARGSGWALSVGLIALPYYLHTSREMTRQNFVLIEQVLADLT